MTYSGPRVLLTGDLPSPAHPPRGCRFRSRCPLYVTLDDADQRRCAEDDPTLKGDGVPGREHTAACHFARVVDVV